MRLRRGARRNDRPQVAPHAAPGKRGLDGLNAFVAGMRTAFGAFVPAYLAGQGWTQAQIGLVLTAETVTSMLAQVPGGAFVDVTRRRRLVLGIAILGAAGAALATRVRRVGMCRRMGAPVSPGWRRVGTTRMNWPPG